MKKWCCLLLYLLPILTIGQSTKNVTDLTWKELTNIYQFPDWYIKAKFGIWVHWGAQTKPAKGGGWYARHLYMQDVGNESWGKNAYKYHLKNYGHPSKKGYKEVLNSWKAKNLDTDALVHYFKSIGAKYFMALANHHDHFDNFNSTYHPWNSVNIGPKKDIIKLFSESAKKANIPFGVSSHDDRFLEWWKPAFGSDTKGKYKGIPYDGNMTLKDGKGTWWEGLDPTLLYGLPPEKRTPKWIKSVKENWLLRHKELVTSYNIDFLWFDGYGFPYKDYGKEAIRTFFNHKYKLNCLNKSVVIGKISNEKIIARDIERGGSNTILKHPWQGIITFTDWFYKKDVKVKHNTRTIIEMLVDIISKNGNLLLNVELLPDGTIPKEQKKVLDKLGNWIHKNKEAIYGSTSWLVYGDNIYKAKNKKEEHFNERTLKSKPYKKNEVRFTVNNNTLYIFVLNPKKGIIKLPKLGLNSEQKPNKISKITILSNGKNLKFEQKSNYLSIEIPKKHIDTYTLVLKVKNAL